MKEDEILTPKRKEMLFPIIITQSVCIALILLTLFAVKLFFKGTYKEAKKWYDGNFCIDTSISEVLEVGESDEV